MKLTNARNVLVTGATGFVGANLARKLVALGCVPHVIKRKNANIGRIKDVAQQMVFHDVDLLNRAKINKLVKIIKPDIIFHLATYGGYVFQNECESIMVTNINGTTNLLNACLNVGFTSFINTGSSSEYGIKNKPMKETDILEPITNYGVSKASVTLLCQAIAMIQNLPIVTLRLFSVYGYYEAKTRLIPYAILCALKNKPMVLSSTRSVRDFVFIEDAVDAYIRAAELKGKNGEIFNIGYGEMHSSKEVVEKIVELTGTRAKPQWGKLFNPRNEPKTWVADITKSKKMLGWKPRYDLSSGLKKTVEWFRQNKEFYCE